MFTFHNVNSGRVPLAVLNVFVSSILNLHVPLHVCIVQLFPDSIVWHGYRHFVSPASGIGHATIQCYYLRACPLTIEWWMYMYMWKCCNLLWFPGRQKVHAGAKTLPFGQTKCRWSVHKLILFWTTFSYLKEFKVISKNLLGCLITKGYIFLSWIV